MLSKKETEIRYLEHSQLFHGWATSLIKKLEWVWTMDWIIHPSRKKQKRKEIGRYEGCLLDFLYVTEKDHRTILLPMCAILQKEEERPPRLLKADFSASKARTSTFPSISQTTSTQSHRVRLPPQWLCKIAPSPHQSRRHRESNQGGIFLNLKHQMWFTLLDFELAWDLPSFLSF